MAVTETTLLSVRPSRIIVMRYYVGAVFLLILAFLVVFFNWAIPSIPPIPRNVVLYGVTFFFLFIAIILVLVGELKRLATKYVVTDFRVIRRDGILRKTENVMPYTKLERIQLTQGILDRIVGIGTLTIDTGEDQILIESIRDPRTFERTVMSRVQRVR